MKTPANMGLTKSHLSRIRKRSHRDVLYTLLQAAKTPADFTAPIPIYEAAVLPRLPSATVDDNAVRIPYHAKVRLI